MHPSESFAMARDGVVVAGEALMDLIAAPDGSLHAVPGGGPFNVARTIARLGQPCAFLGALSTDAFGRRLRSALGADGVDLALVQSTNAPSTLAIAELDRSGAASYRFYLTATAAGELRSAQVGARASATGIARAFHVGTLGLVMEPIGSVLESLVAGLGADVILMVDPNCRPEAIVDHQSYAQRIRAIVSRADIVKVSSDDLRYLFPQMHPDGAARELLRWGASLVLTTSGAEPVGVVGAQGLRFDVPVPRIHVVDTIGCGDAFGGAFLAWFARRGFRRANLFDRTEVAQGVTEAIAAATITCQRIGAEPPTREELVAAVERGAG